MEKFVSPLKKRKVSQQWKCFICKKDVKSSDNYKVYSFNPTLSSIDTLIDCIKKRHEYGELEFSELYKEIKDMPAQDLFNQGISYHKQCYASSTNKSKIERGKVRFEKGKESSSTNVIVNKSAGRPKKPGGTQESESRTSRDFLFDKYLCIFCQEGKSEILHSVETVNMGNQFLEIGKQRINDAVKRRLSLLVADGNPLSAVTYDMKYHLSCLVKNKRCCQKHPTNSITISEDAKLRLIADLEIIEVIKSELSDERDKLIDMNEIHDAYINILHEHCYSVPEKPNFKKYLKKLILDNIQDVHFNLPRCKTKPEQVMSTRTSESAIRNSVDMVIIIIIIRLTCQFHLKWVARLLCLF